MTQIRTFEDLDAWRDAHRLAREIYRASGRGEFSRDFALRDQIRRAALSTMSNIAEGFESRTNRLFIDFLGRARASAGEVRSQLYLAKDEGYIDPETFDQLRELAAGISRQICGFSRYLQSFGERSDPGRVQPAKPLESSGASGPAQRR